MREQRKPHYQRREAGPGEMHPTTEKVIQAQGAKPGSVMIWQLLDIPRG